MKFILNSLYGRFGMKKAIEKCKILNLDEYTNIEQIHDILSVNKLSNDFYLINYHSIIFDNIYIQKKISDKFYYK